MFKRRDDDLYVAYEEPERERRRINVSPRTQGLLAFVITLVAGLLCGFTVIVPQLAVPASPVAGPTPDYSIPTAREAYVTAVEAIRAEEPGARLASAAGAWTPPTSSAQVSTGRTGWTFSFYLPSSNEMVNVVVNRAGAAEIGTAEAWAAVPGLLEDQRWRADSSVAAAVFAETCGAALNDSPDASVEARLSTAEELIAPMWHVVLRNPGEPLAACEVRVDATTGTVR